MHVGVGVASGVVICHAPKLMSLMSKGREYLVGGCGRKQKFSNIFFFFGLSKSYLDARVKFGQST